MTKVAIVGGGPREHIPDLTVYVEEEIIWIGADHGSLSLLDQGIIPNHAVGDFDSVTAEEKDDIMEQAHQFKEYPAEKDETDLEIALRTAYKYNPTVLYLFGVTGGRLDHELINIQLLYPLHQKQIRGVVIDKGNWVELKEPGLHEVAHSDRYPHISYIPLTPEVSGLTLSSFYYPLENATVTWGSTLCISNKLISEKGTFSFEEGILLLVKSRDVIGGLNPGLV
ncbi:thiamine diphosphokinase [Pontibacillus salicampi]|uniref:Thiamine diphosphokinase n=1 Tax=Pontibacillus salicampi TaxID=1449801 RepID=A0ABV6LNW4_9BACI